MIFYFTALKSVDVLKKVKSFFFFRLGYYRLNMFSFFLFLLNDDFYIYHMNVIFHMLLIFLN